MNANLAVPANITFEQAIDLSQSLLDAMVDERLAASQTQTTIADLVATENGARGFFVTYLGDRRSQFDLPSDAVVAALKTAPAIVAELLVKNLAMSSAMAMTPSCSARPPTPIIAAKIICSKMCASGRKDK